MILVVVDDDIVSAVVGVCSWSEMMIYLSM